MKNRFTGVGLVALSIAIVGFLLVMDPDPVKSEEAALDRVIIEPRAAVARPPSTVPLVRVAPDERSVRVFVLSPSGARIPDAWVYADAGRFDLREEPIVPAMLGEAVVRAPGFAERTVRIEGEDVQVTLPRGYSVRGRVFDVATGFDLEMPLVLRQERDGSTPRRLECNGGFEFSYLERGVYVLEGKRRGYVDLCRTPNSGLPGIELEVVDEDLWLEIPVYPIFVGAASLRNATNLEDRVLGALAIARSKIETGVNPPRYAAALVEKEVEALLRRSGYDQFFLFTRVLTDPSQVSVMIADVAIRVPDAGVTRASVPLRSFSAFVAEPIPHLVTIDRQWPVGSVRIVAGAPLVLRPRGAIAGGLRVERGETRLELPRGEYRLGPPAIGSLLDPREWSRSFVVPSDESVAVGEGAETAIVTLEASDAWKRGLLEVEGGGRIFSLWRHADFPLAVYASPGRYRFRIAVAGQGGASYRTLWKRVLVLEAGQKVTLRVGEEEERKR